MRKTARVSAATSPAGALIFHSTCFPRLPAASQTMRSPSAPKNVQFSSTGIAGFMLAKPALHASQEPGPANSQVAHPALHCSHRPSISLYPARHAAHTVVEPTTHFEQPGTEQAGRILREEERERPPLLPPPLPAPCPPTSPRSDAAISTATKRRIGSRRRPCIHIFSGSGV